MGTESEHKYTVNKDKLPDLGKGIKIIQGYLPTTNHTVTRIRQYGTMAYLTIKGERIRHTCPEFEYEIPLKDAKELFKLCVGGMIEKTRYIVNNNRDDWEVDFFEGDNEGLIVAELEFEEMAKQFAIPDWADQDVSFDKRYFNSNLVKNPYKDWHE